MKKKLTASVLAVASVLSMSTGMVFADETTAEVPEIEMADAVNFFFINSSFSAAFFVIIIVLIFTCDYSADTGVEHTANILLFL